MNILFTGSEGFIARELIKRFKKEKYVNKIYEINRKNFNLLNLCDVENYFSNKNIDFVVHCAISGGRRGHKEHSGMFYENIRMFENLASQRKKYIAMISFGSGAEMERTNDIMLKNERQFLSHHQPPKDYYGFSKYVIAKRINDINENICNFRIFNVFGSLEKKDRMIKSNINRFKAGDCFIIHQNKFMDFFSAEDLYRVVNFYFKNFNLKLDKDINMCYINKVTLFDICKIIDNQNNIRILKDGFSPAYCGDGYVLSTLALTLQGLEESIKKMRDCNG